MAVRERVRERKERREREKRKRQVPGVFGCYFVLDRLCLLRLSQCSLGSLVCTLDVNVVDFALHVSVCAGLRIRSLLVVLLLQPFVPLARLLERDHPRLAQIPRLVHRLAILIPHLVLAFVCVPVLEGEAAVVVAQIVDKLACVGLAVALVEDPLAVPLACRKLAFILYLFFVVVNKRPFFFFFLLSRVALVAITVADKEHHAAAVGEILLEFANVSVAVCELQHTVAAVVCFIVEMHAQTQENRKHKKPEVGILEMAVVVCAVVVGNVAVAGEWRLREVL